MSDYQFAPPPASLGRDGKLRDQPFPQTVRTTVLLDSRDRDYDSYPSSSSFALDLPDTLLNVSSAVLVSAELPLSYYVFSSGRGNSSLTVGLDGSFQTVTVPDGNYTTTTMASTLGALLSDALGSAVTVSFDAATMRCTLAAPAAGTVAVDTTAAVKKTEWGLAYYLGFPRGAVTSGTGGSVTGTAVASMNPENYLLLDVEELNGIGQGALYATAGSGRRVFAKVPLCGDSYQYNYYDKTLTYVEARPPLARLARLRVAIRFHDGTTVDLNGGEWSMSLEFVSTLTRAP